MSAPDPYRPGFPGPQQPYPTQQGVPQQPQTPYPAPWPQQTYPYPQTGWPQPQVPAQPAAPQAYPQAAQPIPVQPIPVQPVPVQPTPAQPIPVQPAPVQPQTIPQQQPARPTAARPLPVSAASGTAATSAPATPTTPTGAAPLRPVLVKKTNKDEPRVYEDADDPDAEERPPDVVKAAPPWLISMVVHMVLLIVMGLLYMVYPRDDQPKLEVVWAERLGEQTLDSTVLTSSPEPIETLDTTWSQDLQLVEDPLAAPPTLEIDPLVTGMTATSDVAAPTIGMALSGREKGAKKALLAAYGGTKLTEEAVFKGLQWLKKNQRKDGSWSLAGPYSDGATQENSAAATAMALLAFQGAGNTHREGEFKDVVAKGWDWLLKQQDAEGNFVRESIYNQRLYTQAQCTIAICELYGMTHDKKYQKPAQLAIDYAIKAQDPQLGGWRYTPRQDSDLSVTGWFVMALQSAMMAGLEVPSPNLDNISKFLDAAQHNDGAQYAYKVGQASTLPMTAEGLLCRQYLGWKHEDPRLRAGVALLLGTPIDYSDQNVYYWYYATQVVHHMGGQEWEQWNSVMRNALPNAQTKTGAEAGSWAPSSDRWGANGGRLYVTCLSIYMLEVYYRHLPIYKHQIQ